MKFTQPLQWSAPESFDEDLNHDDDIDEDDDGKSCDVLIVMSIHLNNISMKICKTRLCS